MFFSHIKKKETTDTCTVTHILTFSVLES